MEISLREWLIIGGILVIALILFDGWRRIRGNRSRIRMNIDRSVHHEDDSAEPSQSNPELPNGGARKIAGQSHAQRHEPSFSADSDARFDARYDESFEPTAESAESDRIPDWPEPEPELTSRSQPGEQQDLLAGSEPELDPLFDDVPVERNRRVRRDYVDSESRFVESRHQEAPAGFSATAPDEAQFSESEPRHEDPPLTARRDEDESSEPEPLSLDFDPEQPIPVLMDRVRPKTDSKSAVKAEKPQPQQTFEHREPEPKQHRPIDDGSSLGEALEMDDLQGHSSSTDDDFFARAEEVSSGETASIDKAEPAPVEENAGRFDADSSKKRPAPEISADPEEMLVIFVVARQGQSLPGAAIRRIAEACGMEIGEMEIYHRHEQPNAQGSLQFSMANAIQPGTFDLDSIDELETPAVTFFMSMRDPADPMYAYECMLATAETLARHLEAEMLDGDRSVMRPQTKEHYRERIRDFEIHKRVRRAH